MRCVTTGQATCLKLGPESPDPGVPQAFYNKTLDADRDRVSDLFERASGSGIEIERRSVSDEELSELTGAPHDSLVMALVDRRYLYRSPPNSVSWLGLASPNPNPNPNPDPDPNPNPNPN